MAFQQIPEGTGLRASHTIINDDLIAIRGGEVGTANVASPTNGMRQYRSDLDCSRVYDDGSGAANNWASHPQARRYRITHEQLTEAVDGAAQAITIATLPANSLVYICRAKTATLFAGGGVATLEVTVGDAGSADRYCAAYDLLASVSATNMSTGVITSPYENSASFAVTATFTPDESANLADLTAGEVDIWLAVYTLPEI